MTTEENLQRDQSPTISGETDNGKAQAEEYHIISPNASKFRKAIVLILVCLALFVDSFNTGGMIICLNEVRRSLSLFLLYAKSLIANPFVFFHFFR